MPQFYLREFSTPETRHSKEPQVWIFSKNNSDGIERPANVRKICAKRYLYSPLDEIGERNWEVDDELERVESLLGQIWSEIASDFVDFGDESIRKALSLFIATTHARHPDNLNTHKSIHQQIVHGLDKLPKNPDGSPNVDCFICKGDEFDFDPSDWDSYKKWDENDHHRFFTKTIRMLSGNMAQKLLEKRWSVVFADNENFITSDKPVVIQHMSKEVYGYGTHGAIIGFPLSPTRVLIMDDQHHEPANQYYPLKTKNLGAFNYDTWCAASRFMVTGRSVPEVLSEILEWAESEGFA